MQVLLPRDLSFLKYEPEMEGFKTASPSELGDREKGGGTKIE
jgi:hypothetical protein